MTPRNAGPLIAARQKGLRPAEAVIVSFVGTVEWPNPTVYADPGQRYEWGFLRDLPVIVAASQDRMPGSELRRILEAGPRTFVDRDLMLVDVEARQVAEVCLARRRLWTWPSMRNDEVFA